MVHFPSNLTTIEKSSHRGRMEMPEPEFVYLQTATDGAQAPHFFDRLTEAEKMLVAASGELVRFRAGELLFRRGSPHGGIYIVYKGRIRTFYVAPSGREITLAYWSASHFVGGPEVFGGGMHVWSGMAMTDVEVLHLDRTQVAMLIHDVPSFAMALIEGLVFKGMCFSSLVQMLGTYSASSRLANLLLGLCKVYGSSINGEILIMRSFTHDELASLIGVTRQWVTITLSKFRASGFLRTEGRRIIVTDIDKLRSYSH
jgi:CRP/FNR family transcriptional regulator, cyclic AMP receptor protein